MNVGQTEVEGENAVHKVVCYIIALMQISKIAQTNYGGGSQDVVAFEEGREQ